MEPPRLVEPKPAAPCWSCKREAWEKRPDGVSWVCGYCHPGAVDAFGRARNITV